MPVRLIHVIRDSNLTLSCIFHRWRGERCQYDRSRWPTLASESPDRKGCRRWWLRTLPSRASCFYSASYWCMDTGATAASPDSPLSCFTRVWYVIHFFSWCIIFKPRFNLIFWKIILGLNAVVLFFIYFSPFVIWIFLCFNFYFIKVQMKEKVTQI